MPAQPPALRTDFMLSLSISSRKMHTMFDNLGKEHDLTLSRARLLHRLARSSDVNQTELASLLEIEHSSLVRLLDNLEKQGFIQREADATDRRMKRIILTDAGHEQSALTDRISQSMAKVMLAGIDDAALVNAMDVLNRITQNIKANLDASPS